MAELFQEKNLIFVDKINHVMQSIEIQKGVKVGFEELISGVAQMGTEDLEKFTDRLSQLLARRKASRPSERELELLKKIYEPLKSKLQGKYDELIAKMNEETITEQEHQELLTLAEVAEAHNVEWLKAMVELAQLRAVSVEELKRQLGLDQLS